MNVFEKILRILNSKMDVPDSYGWFHLTVWAVVIASAVILCWLYSKKGIGNPRAIVLIVAILVTCLEIYKQINYTFRVESGGIVTDYQWYIFPWQFCSMPMYVGLLAGLLKKDKVQDSLMAFLATYAIFAGACVMFYPNDAFTDVIGINLQTSFCHGSMIVVGIYLLYTGYVKTEHKTILKAIPVFAAAVTMAVIMNEIAYRSGLLETETFNMFFISPYCAPSLPVYSLVQAVVPFPLCLVIYISAFSLAAYIMLLIAMAAKKIFTKKTADVPIIEYTQKDMSVMK